jgi:hypothetical protein
MHAIVELMGACAMFLVARVLAFFGLIKRPSRPPQSRTEVIVVTAVSFVGALGLIWLTSAVLAISDTVQDKAALQFYTLRLTSGLILIALPMAILYIVWRLATWPSDESGED